MRHENVNEEFTLPQFIKSEISRLDSSKIPRGPDFVIAGAKKCGTGILKYILEQHSMIVK